MAQLIVRRLDDSLVHALKRRAARHGRSAEAEHRAILSAALASEQGGLGFKEILVSMPDVGDDTDFVAPRDMPREAPL